MRRHRSDAPAVRPALRLKANPSPVSNVAAPPAAQRGTGCRPLRAPPEPHGLRHNPLRHVPKGPRALSCWPRGPQIIPPVARTFDQAGHRVMLQHAGVSGIQRRALAEPLWWAVAGENDAAAHDAHDGLRFARQCEPAQRHPKRKETESGLLR